ncbi:MAG TPA: MBL fold metallo-hydrolase [Gemmatimonadaceae bacterium]
MKDRQGKIRKSKQFHNGRFRNTYPMRPIGGPSMKLFGEFFFGGKKRNPSRPLPVENPVDKWSSQPVSGLRVTTFGHSTVLIEIDGARILTDPVFSDYAAPFPLPGRKRFHPVPAQISSLPKIDAIIQSHDHYDHLSRWSWKKIAKLGIPVITSLGVGARLEKFGVDPLLITEIDWWESHEIPGTGVTLTAAPAQHFSGRSLTDRNLTLWSSWGITGPRNRVFFSGDTGLTDELEEIGKRLGPFDLVMLEIGASNPAWADIHLGPVNAMRAFEMLGGGVLLPIHWGTFDLALHRWKEPVETLLSLKKPADSQIITPPFGRPVEPSLVAEPTRWWEPID